MVADPSLQLFWEVKQWKRILETKGEENITQEDKDYVIALALRTVREKVSLEREGDLSGTYWDRSAEVRILPTDELRDLIGADFVNEYYGIDQPEAPRKSPGRVVIGKTGKVVNVIEHTVAGFVVDKLKKLHEIFPGPVDALLENVFIPIGKGIGSAKEFALETGEVCHRNIVGDAFTDWWSDKAADAYWWYVGEFDEDERRGIELVVEMIPTTTVLKSLHIADGVSSGLGVVKGKKVKVIKYKDLSPENKRLVERGTELALKDLKNKKTLNINELSTIKGLELIKKGEGIWEIDATIRGNALEYILANTYYKDKGYGHVGRLRRGFFFTDFNNKINTVSLKTTNTLTNKNWMYDMKKEINKLATQPDHVVGFEERIANKYLHIVVPCGETVRLGKDFTTLTKFSKPLKINLVVTEL